MILNDLRKVIQWDKRPLYVPNFRVVQMLVQKNSRMTNRRIRFDFKLRLQDIPKVPAIVKEIEEMIRSHQQIDGVTHRLVGWRQVGDYYASIWLSCYTKSTEQDIKLSHYIAVEQSVLERCTAIIYKNGADFASSTELTLRSNGLASAEILERPQEAHSQDSKQVRIAKEGQPVQSRERGFYESRNRVLQAGSLLRLLRLLLCKLRPVRRSCASRNWRWSRRRRNWRAKKRS